jgi:hypothetical protein
MILHCFTNAVRNNTDGNTPSLERATGALGSVGAPHDP